MKRTARSKTDPKSPISPSKGRREEEVLSQGYREKVSRENRNFTQVYELGWRKLNMLLVGHLSAARFWVFLAEQVDSSGVVVATQATLAKAMGVSSTKTIQRWSTVLEDCRSLVRIPLSGGVYAYALNPEEVWKAYDKDKEFAAFYTKKLVSRSSGASPGRRRLKVLMDVAELPGTTPKN